MFCKVLCIHRSVHIMHMFNISAEAMDVHIVHGLEQTKFLHII